MEIANACDASMKRKKSVGTKDKIIYWWSEEIKKTEGLRETGRKEADEI